MSTIDYYIMWKSCVIMCPYPPLGGQELYVDMQPVNMHEDGEDVPCMECFTSHDRDIRQDLRT